MLPTVLNLINLNPVCDQFKNYNMKGKKFTSIGK